MGQPARHPQIRASEAALGGWVRGSAEVVVEDLPEHVFAGRRVLEKRHGGTQFQRVDAAEDLLGTAARYPGREAAHSIRRGPSTGCAR